MNIRCTNSFPDEIDLEDMTFQCPDTNMKLELWQTCNDYPDCPNGEDESYCNGVCKWFVILKTCFFLYYVIFIALLTLLNITDPLCLTLYKTYRLKCIMDFFANITEGRINMA